MPTVRHRIVVTQTSISLTLDRFGQLKTRPLIRGRASTENCMARMLIGQRVRFKETLSNHDALIQLTEGELTDSHVQQSSDNDSVV